MNEFTLNQAKKIISFVPCSITDSLEDAEKIQLAEGMVKFAYFIDRISPDSLNKKSSENSPSNKYENVDWKIRGAILGMESQGAKYVKHDDECIFFDVPKSSELYTDQAMLERANQATEILTGLRLRIKKEK